MQVNAEGAASQVDQDIRVLREHRDPQENKDLQDQRVVQAGKEERDLVVSLVPRVNVVRRGTRVARENQASQAPLDSLDQEVLWVKQEYVALQAARVRTGPQDRQDHVARKANQDCQERRVAQVFRELLARQASKDLQENKELRVLTAQQASQEMMANQGSQVRKDHAVLQAVMERWDHVASVAK